MEQPKTYLDHLRPEDKRTGAYYFRFTDLELKEDIQKWCLHTHQPMSKWMEKAARELLEREGEESRKGKPDILIRK